MDGVVSPLSVEFYQSHPLCSTLVYSRSNVMINIKTGTQHRG